MSRGRAETDGDTESEAGSRLRAVRTEPDELGSGESGESGEIRT